MKVVKFASKALSCMAAMFMIISLCTVDAEGVWTPAGSIVTGKAGHTATLLNSGKVLVVGGGVGQDGSTALATAELYSPDTNTWTTISSMSFARTKHSATLLPNGKVLVVGGGMSSAELYDPATNSWSNASSMANSRKYHTATLLTNGKVLVAGGMYLDNAELYDPATDTWSTAGSLNGSRCLHTATLLTNGKVLITGGQSITIGGQNAAFLSSAELYDPVANTWSRAQSMNYLRGDGHTATMLNNGKVFVVGGHSQSGYYFQSSTEIYDPINDSWNVSSGMSIVRTDHTATLLQSGEVLIVGGMTGTAPGNITGSVLVYMPNSDSWRTTSSTNARSKHASLLLNNGKTISISGEISSWGDFISSAAIYDPIPIKPTTTPSTNILQSSFIVNWGAVIDASGYYLDVAIDSGFTSFVGDLNSKDIGKVTSYTINGLSPGTTYYYRLRASNSDGVSSYSTTAIQITLPDASTSLTAISLTQTGFTANWGVVSSATGYRLDVALDNGFTSFVTGYNNRDVGNVNSFTVTGLTGNTYYYRVRAYNTGGTSTNSNTISAILPPSIPVFAVATNISQISFIATWGVAAHATGYYLDVATDSGFTNYVNGFNNKDVANVTNYTINGLTAGAVYYYRLRAYNSDGVSAYSNINTQITLPDITVATSATSLSQTGFTANWGFVNSVTGYRLDVALDSAFTSFVTGYNNKDIGNVTSFAVAGLNGTTFYYRVRAYNTGGTSSDSNTISITLPKPPVVPVAAVASDITQTGFTANWGAVGDSTGYSIDVASNSNFTTFVPGYNNKDVGNVTSYSMAGLSSGTVYYYRIRAYNTYGTGISSNTISQSTYPAVTPTPTLSPAVNVTQTSFTVNWQTTNGGTTGYLLDISTTNGFSSFLSGYNSLDVGNVTSPAVTGLTPGTRYYYRVRSYNVLGSSSPSSVTNWQDTLSITPTTIAATAITNTGFTASWGIVGATGYYLDVASNSGFTNFVTGYNNRDVGNVSSYAVTGLTPVQTYYYRVRGYVLGAVTPSSNVISLTSLPTKPAAPNASSATLINDNSFNANWVVANNSIGYQLDLATDSGFSNIIPEYNNKDVGNVTNYNVTGLSTGSTYYYRIRAYNAGGTSPNSNTIMVLTPGVKSWTITADVTGGNGTVSCTSPVNNGTSTTCTVTPSTGYQLATFTDNGVDKKASVTGSSYGIADVTANHVIDATFTLPINATKPADCDNDNTVTIAEVQSAINMFLGLKAPLICVDLDNSGSVSIAEVQKGINAFLGL